MKRRSFAGVVPAGASLLALVGGLAVIDERVRDQIARLLDGGGVSADFSHVGYRFGEVTSLVWLAIKDQSIEHAPLVIFGVAASVLVVLMLRT